MAGTDVIVERILTAYGTITIVGAALRRRRRPAQCPPACSNTADASFPVNPHADSILGEPVYRMLREVPVQISLVDVFRPSEQTPDIARQAVAAGATALWLQLGIASQEAWAIAEETSCSIWKTGA